MGIRVLFVCVENARRSQMAEAFAAIHGGGVIESWSAGSHPADAVDPFVVDVMREKGIDLSLAKPKHLDDVPQHQFDFVISMGCGDACKDNPGSRAIEWDIADPKNRAREDYVRVRDDIEQRVLELIETILTEISS